MTVLNTVAVSLVVLIVVMVTVLVLGGDTVSAGAF